MYLAEQLAKHLREKNGIELTVHHRELEKADAELETGAAQAETAAE